METAAFLFLFLVICSPGIALMACFIIRDIHVNAEAKKRVEMTKAAYKASLVELERDPSSKNRKMVLEKCREYCLASTGYESTLIFETMAQNDIAAALGSGHD